jgi:HipA-like protein
MTTTIAGPDLRDVNDADVYLNDEIVASLTRLPGDEVRFAYNSKSQTPGLSARDRSVSWSLLINGNYPLTTTGGAVPPFFAGLLPEGVRLGVVTSSTKTSADDHLTLLLAIGADTIAMFAFCRRAPSHPRAPQCSNPTVTPTFVRFSNALRAQWTRTLWDCLGSNPR